MQGRTGWGDAFGNVLGDSLAAANSSGDAYNSGGQAQGVGPRSAANYRNGSDIESDNYTLQRQTQPYYDQIVGEFDQAAGGPVNRPDDVLLADKMNSGGIENNEFNAQKTIYYADSDGMSIDKSNLIDVKDLGGYEKIKNALRQKAEVNSIENSHSGDELIPYPKKYGDDRSPNTGVLGSEEKIPSFSVNGSGPTINPDNGAGAWGSQKPSGMDYAVALTKKQAYESMIPAAGYLSPDAAANLQHYFGNSGVDFPVDLKRIVETTDAGRDLYMSQFSAARDFAESNAADGMPLSFASQKLEQRRFIGNENWYLASGTFSGWSNANVIRNGDSFAMDFNLNFYDKYNWDAGKSAEILGYTVTDREIGKFHVQGLAREFELKGQLPLSVTWQKGSTILCR